MRDDEVNRKIEEAAAIGASIEEIAFYADVHRATLYRWMEADEDLRDRIRELQEKPILKARQTIVKALDNPDHAYRYLEKKRSAEFGHKAQLELSGRVDQGRAPADPEATRAAVLAFEEAMRKALTGPAGALPMAVPVVEAELAPPPR